MIQDYIVQELRQRSGFVSGEDLSRRLKISRAAVWKHVHQLRAAGYKIQAVPHRGYQLVQCPDRLTPAEIKNGLETIHVGGEILCYETVGSTMDEAFRLAAAGAGSGTVVCAEGQTQGRGRQGREWSSPKGRGLYFSLILRPPWAPGEVAKITFLTAVAVCEAARERTGVPARIKWPNDILVGRNKLAGILTEMNAEVDRVRFVVVGVGLNVNTLLSQLPRGATSLKAETQKSVPRVPLLQDILRSFDRWYGFTLQQGPEGLFRRWRELADTIGRRVRVGDGAGRVEGKAVDLSADGGLVIVNADGDFITRMSGDVEMLD